MISVQARFICAIGTAFLLAQANGSDWPQFRGPNCSGVSADTRLPLKISPTNFVLWSVDVPWSPSSPCVARGKVFVTTFVDGELQTRCYSAASGQLVWTRGLKPDTLEIFHSSEGSPAASTPASDGKRVVSYFGSFGLLCYDLKGKELWRHPLPLALSGGSFGTGTSPILVGHRVLLNRDLDQNSTLLAVDLATGKTLWETPRPAARGSFGTPIVWRNNGLDQVTTPGSLRLNGYDLRTGKEQWAVEGVTSLSCTTPVTGDGLLFFAAWSPGKSDGPMPAWDAFLQQNDKNGDGEVTMDEMDPASRDFYRGMDVNHDGKITKEDYDLLRAYQARGENVLLALKPGGQGDISKSHVAWKVTRGLPYVPSPLYYQGRLYLIRDGGMVSSFDARTGKPFYQQERIEAAEQYYASPVAANGHIYVVSVPGKLTVLKAGGEKPEILHQAAFGDRVFATPALADNKIFLRTQAKLYAFGQ